MAIVTRFAPSPTGYLHIGGARTALFNYYYTKKMGGTFHLRIEDTDKQRSTQDAVRAILDGLHWLGVAYDGDVVYQSANLARHQEVATSMLDAGVAYRCYASPAELEQLRASYQARGETYRTSPWRDRPASTAPKDVSPAIRLKLPRTGETTIHDRILGTVVVQNSELDDLILLRADGTPTYMFAVVVDDHDMGVTHVIRGDDHFTNAFRQYGIYAALGWDIPTFAHVPLIYGEDGLKLSKRRGAVAVDAWRDMGYLPEAMRNYLLRLGWGHGNDDIISDTQAIAWFDIADVHASPARFDRDKLKSLNHHYMQLYPSSDLFALCRPFLSFTPTPAAEQCMIAAMDSLKVRAKTLLELSGYLDIYMQARPLSAQGQGVLAENSSMLLIIRDFLTHTDTFDRQSLHDGIKRLSLEHGVSLGHMALLVRLVVTGESVYPTSSFDLLSILGQDEVLKRVDFFVHREA